MRQMIIGVVALILFGAGVIIGTLIAKNSSNASPPSLTPHEELQAIVWPPEEEMVEYLLGQVVEVPASATVFKPFRGVDPQPDEEVLVKARKEEMEAWHNVRRLEGGRISDLKLVSSCNTYKEKPWNTTITFRYAIGKGRLVTAIVTHKMVKETRSGQVGRAFTGVRILDVE